MATSEMAPHGRAASARWQWMNWLEGGNALLTRELRVALRSPRVWMLLALYISMLGALVLAQFPFDDNLTVADVSGDNSGGNFTAAQRGRDLLLGFVGAQAFLVWLLVPSLACGALAQERERQTLEPLLLSPLSPLQIVWGKAAGVLATCGLLLLGTLPLTSLCFLLGGVSPGEVVGWYAVLGTLAFFFTGIGLFCAATWTNPLRATVLAYAISLGAVPLIVLLSGPGAVVSGLYVLGWLLSHARDWLFGSAKSDNQISRSSVRRFWRGLLMSALIFVALWLALSWLGGTGAMWLVLCGLCIAPYGYFLSRFVLQNAAQAIAKRVDPTPPRREQWKQMQKTWHDTMSTQAPVAPASAFGAALPTVAATSISGASSGAPASTWVPLEDVSRTPREVVPNSAPSSSTKTRREENREESRATYGVKAFLPDNRNAIFARDLRHGLGGRLQTFFRFGYIAVIATEVLLIGYLLLGGGANPYEEQMRFASWSRLQLVLVMLACAWLGSRAIAPEREGQTLPQLLTIPMLPAQIIGGKIASVLFFSGYVVLLGLPFTLIMPMLDFVPWTSALGFLLLEGGFALLCAAWGLSCSLWFGSVRRALGCALGGVAAIVLGGPLLLNTLDSVHRSGTGSPEIWKQTRDMVEHVSPMHLIARSMNQRTNFALGPYNDVDKLILLLPAVGLAVLVAAGLMAWASYSFSRTAQSL